MTRTETTAMPDPLPRCEHGSCLVDGAGEQLEPPCGCRASGRLYRTATLDYDARRQPKTNRSCVRCQRDIAPTTTIRRVHVVGEYFLLHPADEGRFRMAGSPQDTGWFLIGFDCAKRVGLEWTHPIPTEKDDEED